MWEESLWLCLTPFHVPWLQKFEMTEKDENGTTPQSSLKEAVPATEEEEDEAFQERCAICLERFENGDDVCYSNDPQCTHIFHRECVFEWLLKNNGCPCCRRSFLGD